MKSKISFFNRTIFCKNFTRFWPVWALYLATLFFSMPVTLYLRTHRAKVPGTGLAMQGDDKLYYMLNCIDTNVAPFLVCAFSIISAIAVFSYLYTTRSCYMIHALPVTRKELYITNYISGLSFMLLPQLLIFLLSIFVCIANNVTAVEYLFWWLIFVMGMSFFFYSLSVFCCMIAGQPFAAFAFFAAGNILYVILKFLVSSTINIFCYGFEGTPNFESLSQGKDAFLSPLLHLSYKVNFQFSYTDATHGISDISIHGKQLIAWYALLAVGIVILSFLFYKKRHLETAGNILAVRWAKPLFRWASAVVAGFSFALLFRYLFFIDHDAEIPAFFIFAMLFSALTFFLAEMILKKRFQIFRSVKLWLEWCGCCALMLFLLFSIHGDFYGMEDRIPEKNEIASILVNGDYQMYLTEKSDFDQVLALHESLIRNKKEYIQYYHKNASSASAITYTEDGSYYTTSLSGDEDTSSMLLVNLYYFLKNGRQIARSYYVPTADSYHTISDSGDSLLRKLESNADLYLKSNVCYNYQNMTVASGSFTSVDKNNVDTKTRALTTAQAQSIYLALQKDINAGNYPFHYLNGNGNDKDIYYNDISIDGKIQGDIISLYDKLPSSYTQYNQSLSTNILSNVLGMNTNYDTDQSIETAPGSNEANISNIFTISKDCKYTIQELIRQGIIHSQKDLISQRDYFEKMN